MSSRTGRPLTFTLLRCGGLVEAPSCCSARFCARVPPLGDRRSRPPFDTSRDCPAPSASGSRFGAPSAAPRFRRSRPLRRKRLELPSFSSSASSASPSGSSGTFTALGGRPRRFGCDCSPSTSGSFGVSSGAGCWVGAAFRPPFLAPKSPMTCGTAPSIFPEDFFPPASEGLPRFLLPVGPGSGTTGSGTGGSSGSGSGCAVLAGRPRFLGRASSSGSGASDSPLLRATDNCSAGPDWLCDAVSLSRDAFAPLPRLRF